MNKNVSSKSDLFKQITNSKNIENAYIATSEKFFSDGKTYSYSGIDGLCLGDIIHDPISILQQIQKELLQKTPLMPLTKHSIPKKSGEDRTVYTCSIKDRIKSQALYQVLEPIFENSYSSFLFSYRSSKPSYFAARSVGRRYKRNYGQDYILIQDIKDYAENIDHKILKVKLTELSIPPDVLELIDLFLEARGAEDAEPSHKGILQGIPLVSLILNLYLNELDLQIGKRVALYRRVGDDLIAFDKSREKINEVSTRVDHYLNKHKLESSKHKTMKIHSKHPFKFLGYTFHNHKIAICPESESKILHKWKKKLRKPTNQEQKSLSQIKRHLHSVLYSGSNSIHKSIVSVLKHYPLVNDDKQIKRMSQKLYKYITIFVQGEYSERNRRLCKEKVKDMEIPSFFMYYIKRNSGEIKKYK